MPLVISFSPSHNVLQVVRKRTLNHPVSRAILFPYNSYNHCAQKSSFNHSSAILIDKALPLFFRIMLQMLQNLFIHTKENEKNVQLLSWWKVYAYSTHTHTDWPLSILSPLLTIILLTIFQLQLPTNYLVVCTLMYSILLYTITVSGRVIFEM